MQSDADDPKKKDDKDVDLPPPPPPPLLSARYQVSVDPAKMTELKNQQALMRIELDAYQELRLSLALISHYHFPFINDQDAINQFKVSLDNQYSPNVEMLTTQMEQCKMVMNNIRDSIFESIKNMETDIKEIEGPLLKDRIQKLYTDTKLSFDKVISAKDIKVFEENIQGLVSEFKKNIIDIDRDIDRVMKDIANFNREEEQQKKQDIKTVEKEEQGAAAHKEVNEQLYYQPGSLKREFMMFQKKGLTDQEYEALPWDIQALNYIVRCLREEKFKEAEEYAIKVDIRCKGNLYKLLPYNLYKNEIEAGAKVSKIFEKIIEKNQKMIQPEIENPNMTSSSNVKKRQ